MTKKIDPVQDYIPSSQAAEILSAKLGRPIRKDYIRRVKNVRTHRLNSRIILYNRTDILAANIRQKGTKP